jgi:hypothetical protein
MTAAIPVSDTPYLFSVELLTRGDVEGVLYELLVSGGSCFRDS